MVLLNNNKSKCFSKIVLTFACFFSSGKFCRRHDTVFTMINKLLRQSTVFKICNLRNPTLISCHRCIPIMVCQAQRFRHLGHNRIRQIDMDKLRPISNGFKNLMSFKSFCTQNVPREKRSNWEYSDSAKRSYCWQNGHVSFSGLSSHSKWLFYCFQFVCDCWNHRFGMQLLDLHFQNILMIHILVARWMDSKNISQPGLIGWIVPGSFSW